MTTTMYEFGRAQMPIGFGTVPYWHVSAPTRPPRTRLVPEASYDVVIVGGGFTGLWTAMHLLERAPGMSIAIVEGSDVGNGASGRNAGYLTNWMGHSPSSLLKLGVEQGSLIHQSAVQSVREVIETIKDRGIECDLSVVSLLYVASNATSDRRISRDLESASAMGSDIYRPLTGAELRSRVGCARLSSGFEDTVAATENPAKLVRGLADDVQARGVDLFERVHVQQVAVEGRRVTVQTSDGRLYADRVVLARNAWAAQDAPFKRKLLPFWVYEIVTEPLTTEQWQSLGWEGDEPVNDRRFFLINYRKTPDGGIMFGGVDGRQPYGARIAPRWDSVPAVFSAQRDALVRMFPSLSDVRIKFGHGGAIAMTPTLLPQVGLLDGGRIGYSHGYCGHGVAQSHFCTKILVDLLLGEDTERTHLPFVNPNPRRYPPEPVRWLGGLATRAEGRWFDTAGDQGKPTADEPKLLRAVTRLLN